MRISSETLQVLDNCRVDGQTVFINGQLDRPVYEAVNKVLELIGGKWNRKAKGHVFEDDPAERLDMAILTGDVVDRKKEFQFFETPDKLADEKVLAACLEGGEKILEPSAGRGRIVRAIHRAISDANVWAVELDPENVKKLSMLAETGPLFRVIEGDFLNIEWTAPFDAVIMNPPFRNAQDIDHVTHAFGLLRPGGRLVSTVSESPFFRTTAKANGFRQLVDAYGYSEKLPEGTFTSSGTGVNARMVVLRRPL